MDQNIAQGLQMSEICSLVMYTLTLLISLTINNQLTFANRFCEINQCIADQIINFQSKPNINLNEHSKRTKRETYDLISKSQDRDYANFDRYLNLTGEELIREIENELEKAFDKNLNVSITEALTKHAKGDFTLLKNKTHFLNTYNDFKKSYCSKLEHWYLGITLYLPMKMKAIAKEKYFLITKTTLPEKDQMEKYWEYERDLDYQFNIFAKRLRDYLQTHYLKLERTFHSTFTQSTNSTVDLTLFKVIRKEVMSSTWIMPE